MQYTEIRVKSHIDATWSKWLEGLQISYVDHNQTLLCGPIADQSSLFGILTKLYDMGMEVVSVNVSESPITEESSPRSHDISGRLP